MPTPVKPPSKPKAVSGHGGPVRVAPPAAVASAGPSGGPVRVAPPGGGGRRRTKKKGRGGVLGTLETAVAAPLGLAEHYGKDIASTAPGILPGIIDTAKANVADLRHDPVGMLTNPLPFLGPAGYAVTHRKTSQTYKKVVKPLKDSYVQEYGMLSPYRHGHWTTPDVSAFLHEFYDHPLNPTLDALTFLSLGTAGVAKAGSALGKVGLVSDTSRLAKLGDVARGTELKSAQQLAHAGRLRFDHPSVQALNKSDKGTLVKPHTGGIPKRVVAQQFQHILDHFPATAPMVGQLARYDRELNRAIRHEPLKVGAQANDYRRAYAKLSKWQQVAYHFHATAVDPRQYVAHLAKEYAGKSLPRRVGRTMAMLQDPKLIKAYEHPTPELLTALDEGRKTAATLAEHHLAQTSDAGQMAEDFANRPYQHLRMISGAKFEPVKETVMVDGKSAEQIVGKELRGGTPIHELQAQLAAAGKPQPFYHPDMAAMRFRDVFQRSGGGKGIPRDESSLKQNQGILFNTARLALHPAALDQAFLAHTRWLLHTGIHDALLQGGVRVHHEEQLPKGWEYIRRTSGETIGHTARADQAIGSRLDEFVKPTDNSLYERFTTHDPAQAMGEGDYRIAVHTGQVRRLAGEFKRSEHALRMLTHYPEVVWRALVLGLRPGFFTNNIVGNMILAAVRFAGPHFLEAYARTISEIHGPKFVRKMLRSTPGRPELQRVYEEYAPELVQGTAGRTQFEGLGKKLSQGVGPLTAKLAEDMPRKAGFITTITPAVRKLMKADGMKFLDRLKADNATFATYARQALENDPKLARTAIDKVNDALGNYLNLNEFERRTVRGLIPFYSWLRAITTITLKTVADTPGRALVLSRVGEIGTQSLQDGVGPLPDWLLNLVPIGARNADGTQTVLTSKGLNPYSSIPDVVAGVGGLLTGKPGETGKAAATLGLSPFISGAIQSASGKNLYTGADVKSGWPGLPGQVAEQVYGNVPILSLLEASVGHGPTSKLYGKQSGLDALLAYLGVPVRKLDVSQAQSYGQPNGQ